MKKLLYGYVLLCMQQGFADIQVFSQPFPLIVHTAIAGWDTEAVLDTSTSYVLLSQTLNMRIMGSLDRDMPEHTRLEISLSPPREASTAGLVSLDTTTKNVVSQIGAHTTPISLPITYRFSASVKAGIISPTTRTVILTLMP